MVSDITLNDVGQIGARYNQNAPIAGLFKERNPHCYNNGNHCAVGG